jgi:hypothetical protein
MTTGGSTNGGMTTGGSTNGGMTTGGSTDGGASTGGSTNGGSTAAGADTGGSTTAVAPAQPARNNRNRNTGPARDQTTTLTAAAPAASGTGTGTIGFTAPGTGPTVAPIVMLLAAAAIGLTVRESRRRYIYVVDNPTRPEPRVTPAVADMDADAVKELFDELVTTAHS